MLRMFFCEAMEVVHEERKAGNEAFKALCNLPPFDGIVAEVVMTPVETPLLAIARVQGCTIVPGRAMMDPQAALVGTFLDGDPV